MADTARARTVRKSAASTTARAARELNAAKQAANSDQVKRSSKRPAGPATLPPQALPGLPGMMVAPGLMPPPAIGESLAQSLKALSGLSVPAEALSAIQSDYLREASALWNVGLAGAGQAPAAPADARFASPDWQTNAWARQTAALYLLNARTLARLADAVQGDDKARQRLRFAVQQWNAAASPANFLVSNPEALRRAVETGGKSLEAGFELLLNDLRQGHVSQTDERVFEVGKNVATTPGSVVFENELFQLIEYHPLTPTVHERPLLVVPPCINKYYILDLQPDNSLVRYATEQGHRVFIVSWVNPGEELARKTWDDYVEDGVIRAIEAVQRISRQRSINTLGFCIGGTLLATALAVLDARGEQPASSLTLLASFLDFSHTGVMDVFVDEAAVRWREATLGADSPGGGALMKGRDLATTFSFLRPTDLVWNYVVGNYLKGEMPPAFDLLYWNSDSTNMPGPMYCWYLRNTYLDNRLKEPGALQVCGEKIDLGRLAMPAFVVATKEDHIVPWQSAYGSMKVLRGERRFVLGASGHIAGIINPPSKNKRSYWEHGSALPVGPARSQPAPEQWLAGAQERPGSWWTGWSQWLSQQAGRQVPAPRRPGDAMHPVIEPAPGRYVKHRV